MSQEVLRFRGVIKNLSYRPTIRKALKHYDLANFNINTAATSGILKVDSEENILGYSKWVSPKRTRSYPFERIYNTYYLPKKVTIIPVIKDEGLKGDCDRINFITLSWMNLLNVYIILAWYDGAQAHPNRTGKITAQKLNTAYIQDQLSGISNYHQSALHWNIEHFNTDFSRIYQTAIERYQHLGKTLDVPMHTPESHWKQLEAYQVDGEFDHSLFRKMSLAKSYAAAQRETVTSHELERLDDGTKAYFSITNWLGGEYHLTADEILHEGDRFIIQESKNSSKHFPSLSDIKDGLFKLILFTNMDELYLGEKQLKFVTRLKLTGNFRGELSLPTEEKAMQDFASANAVSKNRVNLLMNLNQEAQANNKLQIIISGNQ